MITYVYSVECIIFCWTFHNDYPISCYEHVYLNTSYEITHDFSCHLHRVLNSQFLSILVSISEKFQDMKETCGGYACYTNCNYTNRYNAWNVTLGTPKFNFISVKLWSPLDESFVQKHYKWIPKHKQSVVARTYSRMWQPQLVLTLYGLIKAKLRIIASIARLVIRRKYEWY